MQQSYVQDHYYPLDHLDLFAGSGTLAPEDHRFETADGLIRA
jgi:hypothetical protein